MGGFESRYATEHVCACGRGRARLLAQAVCEDECDGGWPLPAGKSVLELVKLNHAPSMDRFSESDPYIEAWVERCGHLRCPKRSFPYVLNCNSPVFDIRRVLGVPLLKVDGARSDDELLITVYDYEDSCTSQAFGTDVIGSARVKVQQFESAGLGKIVEVPVDLSDSAAKTAIAHARAGAIFSTCTLSLRLWPYSSYSKWPAVKWIYLIRHGESKWNEAEHNYNVIGLLKTTDHSLANAGLCQANGLATKVRDHPSVRQGSDRGGTGATPISPADIANGGTGERQVMAANKSSAEVYDECLEASDEAYDNFYVCDQAYASPLTRAIETALITLQHHPVIPRKGVKLRAEVREVKNYAGRDTVGSYRGSEIPPHVYGALEKLYNDDRAPPELHKNAETIARLKSIPIDPNNAQGEWWSDLKDTGDDVEMRLKELLVQTKLSHNKSTIVVGHSIFFRLLFKSYLSDEWRKSNEPLAERLGKHKMPNCAVIGLKLNFMAPIDRCIERVELLFGTKIHE